MSISNIIEDKDRWHIETGNALSVLKKMPKSFVQTSISSPPYFNLRNYDHEEQIGIETNPKDYIENIVEIYKEVKRVLRKDGTCWINIGEKYAVKKRYPELHIKRKDMIGIPWELASNLRKDGWYLRQIYPWVKINAVPENVNDRPNTSVEYVIFLSKSRNYYFDMESAKECIGVKRNWRNGDGLLFLDVPKERTYHSHCAPMPRELANTMMKSTTSREDCCKECRTPLKRIMKKERMGGKVEFTGKAKTYYEATSKNSITSLNTNLPNNMRYVKVDTLRWDFNCNCNTKKKSRQIVLDPFSGSATTGIVALPLNCNYFGIELNSEYAKFSEERLEKEYEQINNNIFKS